MGALAFTLCCDIKFYKYCIAGCPPPRVRAHTLHHSQKDTKLTATDSDLIAACTEVLAVEQRLLPMLSKDTLQCAVGELVQHLSELQAPFVERICAQPAATWGGLLAKARVVVPFDADPSNRNLPAEERLAAALLRDIEALAFGRECSPLR